MPDLSAVLASPLDALSAAAAPCPAAELRLVPPGAKLVFRAREEAAIARAGEAFGVPFPRQACRSAVAGGRAAFWLGPDEWMLLVPGGDPASIVAALEAALAGLPHALVDVSHRSVTFSVEGREAATVLNAGCPLDLSLEAFPVGMCTRTVLGKTEIVLARTGPELFHLDVWRSFAPYAFAYLEEARREFR